MHLRPHNHLEIAPHVQLSGDETIVTFREWGEDSLVQEIRSTCFSDYPALVKPCADFILARGEGKRPETRKNYFKAMRYLSRYISAYGASYGIRVTEYSDFTTTFIAGFLQWLNGKGDVVPRVNDSGGLSQLSAASVYRLVRDLYTFIQERREPSETALLPVIFELNASKGAHKQVQHRHGLAEAELAQIRRACFDELGRTFELLEEGFRWTSDDNLIVPSLGSPCSAFADLAVAVKAYQAAEGLRLSTSGFQAKFPGLHRAIKGHPYNTVGDVLKRLHFTKRSIVPVVILLAMHFAFEPDTLLQLDWKREEDSFLYGSSRGVVSGVKHRGGFSLKAKPYFRNDRRPYSPGELFSMLRKVTPRTAKLISSSCTQIFCFARRDGSLGYFKNSNQFQKSLDRFVADHGLPHFTLSQFRKTGADIIATVTGGDLAEQKSFLRHKAVSTTASSYQSASSRGRREEQLAQSQNIRVRRVETDGRIETRGASLPLGQRLAATVGFYCLDPYDSPYERQKKGELCKAYGLCPSCPLAQVDRSSARDCRRVMQLRSRLVEARAVCSPSRWKLHWAPQLDAIDNVWLPNFPEHVREQAFSLAMPEIPEIE